MLARDQGDKVFAAVSKPKPHQADREPQDDPRGAIPPAESLEDYGLQADAEPAVDPGIGMEAVTPILAGGGPRFVPVAIDDVVVSAEPACLIDGLLPARGLGCIIGPPKSGKSFLTSDMLCAVARGVPYAGRATMQGPVIYLTGEGVSGFKRRLVAMRRHHGIEGDGIPFYMIENVPDLGSERTDLPTLIKDLDDFIAHHAPDGVRAIALDTLARCMGEADENSARDMGRFVNRCSLLERRYGCVIVVVHHVGKDVSRGGRGSNSLNGAADVTMLVEKTEAYSKVRIDEMKDGPEGQEWRFKLVPYALTETSETPSETYSETSTCVVELLSEPGQAKPANTKAKKATHRRSRRFAEGLSLFTDGAAYDDAGAVVAIASKVIILPHVSAAISFRGKFGLLPRLHADVYSCRSFENLLAAIGECSHIVDDTSEVMVCGYSRDRAVF